MLVDQFGKEIKYGEIRKPDEREISVASIRDRWSTYPSSGLTPSKLAQILKQADAGDVLRQSELFEEMEEKDAHLASQFQTRKLAVQGLDYEIIPASESAEDIKIAEFCREVLEGLVNYDEHVLDLLDALGKGFSMMEIDWDVSEGQAWIKNLKWIHPKKIIFWDSLHPRVLTEDEPARGIDPPPFKFVYHRYKARSGYDTRAGILRVCAWMYLFKNYAIKDWVAFAEIYGIPLRIGKYEPGATTSDKDALIAAISSLGSDAAGIISKATEIEFIEAQKTSSLNVFESLSFFCDNQMSKAVLGQVLTSDSGSRGSGSYALGKVHENVRDDLTEADCKAIDKTFRMQLLRPLVGFNYGWDKPVPKHITLYEAPEDMKAAAETYKILVEFGTDISQEHVSEKFKVPLRKKGETPLAGLATSAKMPVAARGSTAENPDGARVREDIQWADDLTDNALPEGVSAIEKEILNSLLGAIENAGDNPEAVQRAIVEAVPDISLEGLEELLGKIMFAADLGGRIAGM